MPAYFNNRILPSLRFEMILCLVKRDAGALLQMPQHLSRKINMAVETCAHRRSAQRELAPNFDRFLRPFFGISNLLRVPGKFLSEPDRRRVHQMGPAYLNDFPEFFRLGVER